MYHKPACLSPRLASEEEGEEEGITAASALCLPAPRVWPTPRVLLPAWQWCARRSRLCSVIRGDPTPVPRERCLRAPLSFVWLLGSCLARVSLWLCAGWNVPLRYPRHGETACPPCSLLSRAECCSAITYLCLPCFPSLLSLSLAAFPLVSNWGIVFHLGLGPRIHWTYANASNRLLTAPAWEPCSAS
jgi:hypothetical protein